jgi:hypothetical protein
MRNSFVDILLYAVGSVEYVEGLAASWEKADEGCLLEVIHCLGHRQLLS